MAFGDSMTQGVTSLIPTMLAVQPERRVSAEARRTAGRALHGAGYTGHQRRGGRRTGRRHGQAPVRQRPQRRQARRRAPARRRERFEPLPHHDGRFGRWRHAGVAGARGDGRDGAQEGCARAARHPPATGPRGQRTAIPRNGSEVERRHSPTRRGRRVVIVDLYNGLGGVPDGNIGADGLHPTPAGYDHIAQIWFDAIQQHYEQPQDAGRRPNAVLSALRHMTN